MSGQLLGLAVDVDPADRGALGAARQGAQAVAAPGDVDLADDALDAQLVTEAIEATLLRSNPQALRPFCSDRCSLFATPSDDLAAEVEPGERAWSGSRRPVPAHGIFSSGLRPEVDDVACGLAADGVRRAV